MQALGADGLEVILSHQYTPDGSGIEPGAFRCSAGVHMSKNPISGLIGDERPGSLEICTDPHISLSMNVFPAAAKVPSFWILHLYTGTFQIISAVAGLSIRL